MNKEIANFFWHGELTQYEIACIKSAIRNNFDVNLWSYTGIKVDGANSKDAREILSEDHLTKYKQKPPFDGLEDSHKKYASIAAFSDAFRYKLLSERFGWWFDCDQYCLKDSAEYQKLRLNKKLVVAREEENSWVSCSQMYLEKEIAKKCWIELQNRCVESNYTFTDWATIGPGVIDTIIKRDNLSSEVLAHNYFYPISWRNMELLIDPIDKDIRNTILKDSYSLALWNSQLSQKYDLKNKEPMLKSLLYELITR